MPEGAEEGIIRGIYKFRNREVDNAQHRVQLFGSGAIMRCVLQAQDLLADRYGVASDAWSVTSYNELARDAQGVHRWNMLHPNETPRRSYIEQVLEGHDGPFVAASDYVRTHSEQVAPYVPGDFYALGTDGMGRSESRENLRRHFEVDAECVTVAVLYRLAKAGKIPMDDVAKAIGDLGIDPEKVDPYFA